MPHVVIKMFEGRSEELKAKLAEEIAKTMRTVLGCKDEVLSVGVEEFNPKDWPEQVYKPDIITKSDTLLKKPGYNPFA